MEEKYKFNLYPSYIDNTNFKYIKLDDKYISSLVIYDYPSKSTFTQIINDIEKKHLYDMSIYIQKQDTMKVLRDLSYYISNSKSELKTSNDNQIDIDILNKLQFDSKELRKQIQINNEEVYKFNIFITFYASSESELLTILKSFQSKLYSKQIYSNITNFRNLDSYLMTLPLNNYSNKLTEKTYRNITTMSLCNIFPFYRKTVFDKNGIIFGYTKNENNLCIIDIFNDRYLNSNITIFGSSGSGKSYFTKLLILRHFFKEKIQYIFDLEGEYRNLAKHLGIKVINFNEDNLKNCLNIMDINGNDIAIYNEEVFDKKVEEIIDFLNLIEYFNENEQGVLKEAIINTYFEKGINRDIKSLYKENKKKEVYIQKKLKEKEEFPCLYDLLNNLKEETMICKIKNIIKNYPSISNYSNSNLNESLIFDTSNIEDNKLEVVSYYFLSKIARYLKNNVYEKNVIIYVDEIWRYVRLNKKVNIAALIHLLYKSVRKNKASIVTITQDISDFFSMNDGLYGKSILNNSEFKMFFKLEFSDTEFLNKLNVISTRELKSISRLEKGTMLLGFCNNIAILNIKASKYENEIIEGEIENEHIDCIR